ncbi:tetratricopeptide repeat protein [Rickettsia endosymbiont of Polydrusus tereticollis]|uniref:tetratricopeptide repeat protein n=1 Tax=Rickettsia endosymbiont of Polydrusus tereticollis TaxID=3066251 RepID=UPI0031333F01
MKFKHFLYGLGVATIGYLGIQKVTHLLNLDPNHNKDYQTYPIDFVHIREEVEQVVSSEENNIVKIDQLKRIEKEQYKPLIHQLAHKETLEELKDLVIVLKDLGYLATKLGELSRELKYYTEAAVFYQYVITILKEKLNEQLISTEDKSEFIKQEKLDPPQQLTDIQQLIFSAIGGDQEKMSVVQEEAMSNKALLLALRNKTDQEMQTVEGYYQKAKTDNQEDKQKYQELYVKTARELFEKTADKMKDFLAKLYKKAESELGKAPCEYAVVGLGSMALKQMTPYSDLEFAILTENEDYKQSDDPKIKEYFKNLSHLVNFKMINLGESIIPTSQYGLDMSHLVHVAVNFDLGGKTPLGRIGDDKKYELIQTIDGMLSYVHNKESWASHIDKNLPYILENVCYVYGDKGLVKTYKGKVTEFLHSVNKEDPQSRLNCEIRAIKLLEEEAVELDYLQQVSDLKPKETSFKGDLDKLKPNLSSYEGRLFDVKQEIYRLPDRMVYNLGLYYGIEGDSSWDTVEKLEAKGIINSQAALNLKNAITFATTLRLNTYSHHEAQKEDMSIFVRPAETESERTEQAKQIFHLAEADLREQGGLFQYFYTALPLHERLKDFCDQYQILDKTSKQIFFKDTKFYKDDYASKGFIHYRLAQYKEAQNNLGKALDDPHNKDNWQIKITLGNIYDTFGNSYQAIKQFQESLDILKCIYGEEPNTNVATALLDLGRAYDTQGQYDQAIKCYEESLKMNKLIYQNEPNLNVAGALNNLGAAYDAKGQYDQAINYYKESLKMRKLIYQDQPHPDVADSLLGLGGGYKAKGQYDQAINYYEENLQMNKLIHKDQPHPDVAASLNNLGGVYKAKGQYDQAINYYKESLKMRKLIYQDQSHPTVAASLNSLGVAYDAKGQYDQAMKYYEDSLKMRRLIYQDQPHPDVAASLNNLGEVYYRAQGNYDQAINYYKDSLKMNKLIHKDQLHPDIAVSLNNLARILHEVRFKVRN